MNEADFMKLVANREIQCVATLGAEKRSYVAESDRLSSFKGIGRMNAESPQAALWGMLSEHIIAALDMVDSGEIPTKKWLTKHLGDIHNYMYLLEAIWEEQRCQEV
jgi:hypothetical protein